MIWHMIQEINPNPSLSYNKGMLNKYFTLQKQIGNNRMFESLKFKNLMSCKKVYGEYFYHLFLLPFQNKIQITLWSFHWLAPDLTF